MGGGALLTIGFNDASFNARPLSYSCRACLTDRRAQQRLDALTKQVESATAQNVERLGTTDFESE